MTEHPAPAMVRFPGSQRVLLHRAAGRRARTVRTLTGSSDWRRDAAERVGGMLVALAGTRWLPAADWAWPSRSADALAADLRRSMPGLRIVGAVTPRQEGRRRLSLLCRYAGNPVIVKLGADEPGGSMSTEADVLRLLTDRPLPGIDTPIVIAAGALDIDGATVDFLATSAVGLGAQRPALDAPLRTFESDLTQRLSSLAPTGRATGADAMVAVHGDLTPWNLRRTRRGLALFDWEAAGWGPAGSDLDHYRASCDAVRPWWHRRRNGAAR